jgi:tetratricopeptide (TPR) repeat protein
MTIGGDGAEVDWTVGYGPPPEKFHERMMKMVTGNGTYRALTEALARNSKDAAAAFLLARKWADRYDTEKKDGYYRMVVALDPAGTSGTYTNEYDKTSATYTEYAEFALAGTALGGANRSPAPMKAFMAKYPKSQLLKLAYARLSSYYGSAPSKEEATAFFAEYTAKYPDDPEVLAAWLGRITRDKGDFAKGAELADRIKILNRANAAVQISKALADFYLAKGDAEEADRAYGKDFMTNRADQLAFDMVDYANYWAGKGSNLDAAVAAVETAIKLNPESTYISSSRSTYFVQQAAGVYIKAGREAKALEMFGPAFAKAHGADATALKGYVVFWGTQGKNLDDALTASRRLVEIKPNDYYGWYALSVVLLARKDYDGALKAAEKTVELADDDAKDYYRKNIEKIKAAQAAAVKK